MILKIFSYIFIFSIYYFFINQFSDFAKLKHNFIVYKRTIQDFNKFSNQESFIDENQLQDKLNNISINGIKLLIHLIRFLLPSIIFIFLMINLDFFNSIRLNILLSGIPYIFLIKKNK